MPKKVQMWPENGIFVHFGPGLALPAHLVGGCGARAVSRKTPIYFMLVTKLFLTPIRIRIFGPKRPKFDPKSAFLVILGQILPFFAHFVQ